MPEVAEQWTVDSRIVYFINGFGLIAVGETVSMSPLTGGVASDI
jgi:hypothetical protein